MFFHFPYACGFGSLNVALEAAYATYQCKSQIVLPPNDVVINRLVVGESDRDLVLLKCISKARQSCNQVSLSMMWYLDQPMRCNLALD
ncbi:hypothetical protein P8452_12554 [Trifolium repens]|nr:hypothetical protein P8452_12554 [Trifolium repens]